jgi:hypothetical protein
VTNFGALAILAIPGKVLDSDLRLMIALETVTPDEHGDRKVGMRLLAEKARLPYGTARDALARLAASGRVTCTPGSGRGQFSTFRFTVSLTPPEKVLDQEPAPSTGKVPGQEPAPSECEKVLDPPAKGAGQNALTSGNKNTGLKASGLEDSLSPAAEAIRAAVPGIGEREIAAVIKKISEDPKIRYPSAWLKEIIAKGDLGDVIADALRGDQWTRALDRARAAEEAAGRPCAMCRSGDHEHCAGCPCDHKDHPNSDHLISDHLISVTGTPELRDGNTRTEFAPPFSTSPYTNPYPRVAGVNGSAEVTPQPRVAVDNRDLGYATCHACGGWYSVMRGGAFRRHTNRGKRCGGSGTQARPAS